MNISRTFRSLGRSTSAPAQVDVVDSRKFGLRGEVRIVNTSVVDGESNSNSAECNHSL
jgi:hypothetical protein